MKYRYYLPENYDSSVSYPVVMFLHGETRKGNDNEKQLYNAQDLFDKVIEQEKHKSLYSCCTAMQCG